MLNLTTDVRPPKFADKFCGFGLTEVIAPLVVGALTSAGVGAATAGTIASVAAPALVGAGTGALTSALTGGKVLKGAAIGAVSGGTLGGLGSAFPETMGSLGLGGVAGIPATTAGAGAAVDPAYASMIDSQMPGMSASADQIANQLPGTLGQMGQAGAQAVPGNPVASNASKGLFGLSNTDMLLGALGALGSGAKAQPNYGAMPGPGSTAATRGPLFNQPLGTGYLNRTPTQNYTPLPGQNGQNPWYSYGIHGGQMPFFQGNQLNLPQMAQGGTIAAMGGDDDAGGSDDGGGYVDGGGDGTDDQIPARLSKNEYVLTAADVSRIGQGSSAAGAKKLDEMRGKIARDAGARKHQGKVKHPVSYLERAA